MIWHGVIAELGATGSASVFDVAGPTLVEPVAPRIRSLGCRSTGRASGTLYSVSWILQHWQSQWHPALSLASEYTRLIRTHRDAQRRRGGHTLARQNILDKAGRPGRQRDFCVHGAWVETDQHQCLLGTLGPQAREDATGCARTDR